MTPPLYNRDILALAVGLADYPRIDGAFVSGDRRAPLCGSRVVLDMDCDAAGAITRVGMSAEACALGQAAATLFARGAIGRHAPSVAQAARDLTDWLAGTCDSPPDWPGLFVLAPAQAYPARHAAILLTFQLAAEILNPAEQGQAA